MANKELIQRLEQLIKWVDEKHIPSIENVQTNQREIKKAKDANMMFGKILYRLGHRKPRTKNNSKPDPNAFKKKELSTEQVEVKYDNSDAPKDAFKEKPLKEIKPKEIKNDAPKDAFKAKELPSVEAKPVDKTGAKKSRLSKADKKKIDQLKLEGFGTAEMSEELWFSEKAICTYLGIKPPKKAKVVIADNVDSGIDSFKKEVKESKE